MKITNLHHFLKSYFTAQQCNIVENEPDLLTVQLTEDIDRLLMNRPFYWHYIKSIGQEGDPAKLTFVTNPNKEIDNAEKIHFGSPRLQNIISHLKTANKHIKLFQEIDTNVHTPLYPWLIINIKISYEGTHNKSELFSIGLQLINGMMKTNMMDLLEKESLNTVISDYCYTISPLIKINSGYQRIEKVLLHYVTNQTHNWANESLQNLEEEKKLLEYFYVEKNEEEKLQVEKEKQEIINRYTPTITFQVVNGGLVYLTANHHVHAE